MAVKTSSRDPDPRLPGSRRAVIEGGLRVGEWVLVADDPSGTEALVRHDSDGRFEVRRMVVRQ